MAAEKLPRDKKDEAEFGSLGDAYMCYKGYLLPPYMEEDRIIDNELENFHLTKNDVIVAGFPKSGTTWMTRILREMYGDWGLVEVHNRTVVPMIEWTVSQIHTEGVVGMAKKKFIEDPTLSGATHRLLKTRLPYDLLPSAAREENSCKLIHVTRNPKDVCVNCYFLERSHIPMTSPGKIMSWEDFVNNFSQGRVVYGPWITSVTEWWNHGPDENVLHVTYEEMVSKRQEIVQTLSDFLERPLSASDVKRVVKATHSDSVVYTIDESVFRRGMVGEWKNHFTEKQSQRFDRLVCSKLKSKGIEFLFEPYQ
ncbi:sulfotransferase 1B1-like [Ptychodera flava]|uniref:sulfotransferase 1B1-like n=1 Tax=Ptychodera flava TaxID=63121 RepID=UPI00396A359C